jgi:elongation factor 3
MDAMLEKLWASPSTAEAKQAATETAATLLQASTSTPVERSAELGSLVAKLKQALTDAKAPLKREHSLHLLAALSSSSGVVVEPFVVPLLPQLLERCSDQVAPVRSAAEAAGAAVIASVSPFAVDMVLPVLLEGMELKKLWQTKVAAMSLLVALSKQAPEQVKVCLPTVVPVLSACVCDAKRQVKDAAISSMSIVCASVGNRDVDPFIPALISCIARPAEVPDCVHKLSATTFVQTVEAPTLSLLVPLLVRGLAERATAIRRKTAVIIDNMAKLVDSPHDAAVFLPRLLPGLKNMSKETADPEARGVAERAHKTLQRIGAEGEVSAPQPAAHEEVLSTLREVIRDNSSASAEEAQTPVLAYVSSLSTHLINVRNFESPTWSTRVVEPYLAGVVVPQADIAKVAEVFLQRCLKEIASKEVEDLEENEGEDLCNCEFSLAYGGKILLSNTRLWLKRGRRYGLCGPNGSGKSTLMRAIANGQLDGFPPKDELRTVYVEHDIDASEAETPVVEYVYADPLLQDASHPAHSKVEEVLSSVGFSQEMQQAPVASLSGGWKMKLALARAMLMEADILLLDEPTNHLDVTNVAWLQNYLVSLTNVTSMVVSHDSGFLDAVCTDIIHYEDCKLKRYRGNLSAFVEKKPEAKTYYDLQESTVSFKFPEPGFLEGIKSKDRAILKMHKVGFRYPGMEKNVVSNVTLQCSLNSRIGVIGPNGAGKSTVIKLLTGETEPQDGVVWKHPNLRVAYVAQHAFHHIEQHLDKTPNQYIQWRYAIGEDRESLSKVSRVANEEDQKSLDAVHVIDGEKRKVEKLCSRRKLKRSYEYEVQWVGLHPEKNLWLTRDKLIEMGLEKLVSTLDAKEAAAQGLYQRPLTAVNIEKHLGDLGLEAEFASHSMIRGLSGGQRIKLVLAAATWQNPHMVVLDEPTNYLDRESLGALNTALKDFGGGVVVISHSSEFVNALCSEKWTVGGGQLVIEGGPEIVGKKAALEQLGVAPDEMVDALGNVTKVKQPKKALSNKEKKKRDRLRAARRKAGEEVSDSEEEDW